VDPNRKTPDVSIEIASRDGLYQVTLSSPFGTNKTSGISLEATLPEVIRTIRQQAHTHFWLTLVNHYQKPSTSWLEVGGLPEDFNDNGEFILGHQFRALWATPLIDGYICVLMPEEGGRVVVLYPNARSAPDKKVDAHVMYNVLGMDGIGRIGLKATSAGPTHFVMLVSKVPRPLSDFLPPGHKAVYYDWKGQQVISPQNVGPGLFLSEQNNPASGRSLEEIPPDSWDVGRIRINVSNNR
jgi:hypothetical protein